MIFLILLFIKPNIEVSGLLYQSKTDITESFLRETPPNYIALDKEVIFVSETVDWGLSVMLFSATL